MPQYRKPLDIYQGYNFKKDKQTPIGFITKMKLMGMDLAVDQTCKDPMNPAADIKVFAIMSDVLWETGVTDAVYLSGQVSVANKQSIMTSIYSEQSNIEVIFSFKVYEYDAVAKKYFLAFHSGDVSMKGLLEKNGEDLNLTVADDASTEVQSPLNYAFQIGIKPQASEQILYLAVGEQMQITKAWGLKQV